MSLPHAILGFLQVMPMTGYDLKTRAFDQSVAHFWSAVQQQIYRELDKMEGLGWVTCCIEQQTDRPPRKVYNITDDGRAALESWLKRPQPLVQHREPFLIQLFFSAQLTNAQIIALLHDQLVGHRARLEAYQGVVIPPVDELPERRRRTLVGLTLDLGLRMEQMYIDWLTEAIAVVEQLADGELPDKEWPDGGK